MPPTNRTTEEVEKIQRVEFRWAKLIPVFVIIAGLLQFGIGISAAIKHFPTRFSFQKQFLSELGQTQINGKITNETSCMLFTGTIVLLGMSLIPLFLTIKDHSGDADMFSRGLGVSSAVALIGIGITPFDKYEGTHLLCLGFWLLSLASISLLRIVRAFEVGAAAAWSGFISAGLLLAITAYAISFGSRSSAPFAQKIAIVAAIFWGLDLIREASHYTMEIIILRRTHHRAVEQYVARLKDQPLFRANPPDVHRHRRGAK